MSDAEIAKPLTQDQLAEYREQGYVMLGRIVSDEQLASLRAEEARVRRYPFVKEDGTIEKDGLTIFRSQLCDYSEPIRRFVTLGDHVQIARQLVGPNLCFWFNQYVTKLPDDPAGKLAEFPWHQDNGYVGIEPANNVTIWCALDDVDEKNGCVWVMPRSHKKGLLPHTQSKNSWHFTVPVEGDGVPARLKAGEAVAFTGLTLHRSKQNFTNKPRRAFFMEYADAASTYGPEKIPVVKSPKSWLVAGQIEWPTPKRPI
jgi:ectoine hydroxylase-related dioxygenase (phytanoyl-CoA dioxygenase family)